MKGFLSCGLLATAVAIGVSGCSRHADSEAIVSESGTGERSEALALSASIAELEAAVAAAELRLHRLRAVEELENLAAAYGHYVDRSRHDDVADLFAREGVVEILGRGVFIGQDRVREYMHNLGAQGPQPGALFNHMHLQPVTTVSDDGLTASMRARLLVMFGIEGADAQWGGAVYENTFRREDGVWKFDYLHGYQTFYTRYAEGWGRFASDIFAPYDRLPPDRPQSVPYDPYPAAFVPPFHYVNPVSGRDDYYGDPAWVDTQPEP